MTISINGTDEYEVPEEQKSKVETPFNVALDSAIKLEKMDSIHNTATIRGKLEGLNKDQHLLLPMTDINERYNPKTLGDGSPNPYYTDEFDLKDPMSADAAEFIFDRHKKKTDLKNKLKHADNWKAELLGSAIGSTAGDPINLGVMIATGTLATALAPATASTLLVGAGAVVVDNMISTVVRQAQLLDANTAMQKKHAVETFAWNSLAEFGTGMLFQGAGHALVSTLKKGAGKVFKEAELRVKTKILEDKIVDNKVSPTQGKIQTELTANLVEQGKKAEVVDTLVTGIDDVELSTVRKDALYSSLGTENAEHIIGKSNDMREAALVIREMEADGKLMGEELSLMKEELEATGYTQKDMEQLFDEDPDAFTTSSTERFQEELNSPTSDAHYSEEVEALAENKVEIADEGSAMIEQKHLEAEKKWAEVTSEDGTVIKEDGSTGDAKETFSGVENELAEVKQQEKLLDMEKRFIECKIPGV